MSSVQKESLHTLFKGSGLWLLNKPPRTHFDELATQCNTNQSSSEGPWEAAHRLDFETSGCLLMAQAELIPTLRQAFKNSDGLRKIYWAGCSADLGPSMKQRLIKGFIGSRYRSSKKVKFSENPTNFKGYHSVQEVSHRIKKVPDSVKEDFFKRSFEQSKISSEESKKVLQLFEHTYEIELLTGARHQIRAFFESLYAPLKGDPIYAREGQTERLALHSKFFEIQKISGLPEISGEALWI